MTITTQNLFGYRLLTDNLESVVSPKIGAPLPLGVTVAQLRRLIGIQFEYKIKLQAFLLFALASPAIFNYDEPGNTPSIREEFVETFIGCGPSMGFEAKRAAYGAFELITEALANDDDVSPANAAILNALLVNTTRFVGIAEGDGEGFHFMVATYELAKEIARVAEQTPISGAIATLTLLTIGAGFTTNGTDDTAEDVVFEVSSTAVTNPSNYAAGEITAEIIDGEIDSITLITVPGEGFIAGQVVQLDISTVAPQTGATQTTPATAIVASITD
jgi:hypothetical protein